MLDLLIINGHVIDPKNNVNGNKTIAIYNGKVVEYKHADKAKHTIDARGKFVFPGLIDAHAHMFADGTEIGIYPDSTYLPTGVTSAIDCSAGVANYQLLNLQL